MTEPRPRSLERVATASVARATGFAGLAILVTMAGLSGYPVLALETGAALCLILWAALRLKAVRAPSKPYTRTEAWLMLEPRPAWPAMLAQRLVSSTLEGVFRRYARGALAVATALWLASLALRLAGTP